MSWRRVWRRNRSGEPMYGAAAVSEQTLAEKAMDAVAARFAAGRRS